jgi:hypothetical protein
MGTLYDLLGALPSDDAEGLRTAFRKAAKATHPDTNPDNPDAALRFRELVRAYDILTDVDQRTTYDQLLAIALQPPPAATAIQTYETMRKVASNTMAATVITAILVGGYTVFGLFSKPPGAAEIAGDRIAGESQQVASAAQPDIAETQTQRQAEASADGAIAVAAVAPATNNAGAGPIGRLEPVPAFATYNLGIQYYPRFVAAYFDRGVALYRVGDFDRTVFGVAPAKQAEPKRIKNATHVNVTHAPRRPLAILPPAFPAPPERRGPITAALTP